jgi:4-amino-4-deoxy-L-arabinose transferase-like glycosyltransferase
MHRPFDYDAEGSGSLNAVLARSYLRFDWSQTRGMPILSLDRDRAPAIVFYPDHPPLVPLVIVPFYKAFGIGAWQTRLPIALFTLAAILLLHRVLAQFATARVGLIAAAVFAATPMTLYFGGFADVVGLPLIFFVLLALDRYLHFERSPGYRTFAPCAIAFAAAGFCDWPAYVLAPVVVGHFFVEKPRDEWRWAIGLCVATCLIFIAVYAYITLATHSPWTWMADLFTRRSGLTGRAAYSWPQWITSGTRINAAYHTWPLIALTVGWIVMFALRRRAPQGTVIARLLLVWALAVAVIGSKAFFDHEWAWSVFTPGLAVAAAFVLQRLPTRAIAGILVAFAIWTTHGAWTRLYPPHRDRPFSPRQTARAVQLAAPALRDVALLVGNEDEAQLWLYGDRSLRSGIWSIEDFQRRVDDDTVDLMFNFDVQPWGARATGLVFPKIWSKRFTTLYTYLHERYREVPLGSPLADLFTVFDLRGPAGSRSTVAP